MRRGKNFSFMHAAGSVEADRSSNSPTRAHLVLIDAHVHMYDCFDVTNWLQSAFENFKNRAEQCGQGDHFSGVLLLTETANDNWFAYLRELTVTSSDTLGGSTGQWVSYQTSEDCSLRIVSPDGHTLLLIAGRQITTAERLEVLALCTASTFPEGLPLSEVITLVRNTRAIPVIPWGAGKWLGKRGSMLTDLLQTETRGEIFLGDNSGRPVFWRDPVHFKRARARGVRILPGTDPLPFPTESWRPGSFGFAVNGTVTLEHPANDIRRILLDPSTEPHPYGSPERPYRFFRNQIAMQLRKFIS